MIRVARTATPASLDGPASPGGIEKKEAILAYLGGGESDFTAYKRPDVVQALRAMFRKKCAYCEFNYAAGGPEDIEHFRPKGAVVIGGKLAKPGYYWLAAEWSNLLPSCMDCNRKRTKEFAGATAHVSGKANLFPVADEKHRWRSHSKRRIREEPLLLDPCTDDPALHLEFLGDGLVRATVDAAGSSSPKGQASIDVYGLLRADLVEQRAAKQVRVRAAIERALNAAILAQQTPQGPTRSDLVALAARLLEDARTHLDDREPYLAATRAVFREFGL